MLNIRTVKAKKKYLCDYTGETIEVGEPYKRVNINYFCIFHFKLKVKDEQIERHIEKVAEALERSEHDDIMASCGDFGENGL